MILIFTLIIVVLFASLFNVQALNGSSYDAKAKSLNVVQNYFQPERGIFFDRNGVPLVQNVVKYDVYLRKGNYDSTYKDELIIKIKNLIPINESELKTSLDQSDKKDARLLFNLSAEESFKLKEAFSESDDVYFTSGYKREYTYPEEFAHILGYTGIANEEDIKNGYGVNDQLGKYKLEKDLEDNLKGVKGKITKVGDIDVEQEGQPGKNITLTIDSKWQRALYKVLTNYIEAYNTPGGGGIVIDNETGEIIAMSSYPGFDTNKVSQGLDYSYYQELLNNYRKPLSDKVIGAQSTPGSIFKVITAYALLENNVIDENSTYFSNRCMYFSDSEFCEFQKLFYGEMNVERAIYKSSNVFFCNYMLDFEKQYGIQKFVDTARLFNIGSLTGVDLSGEVQGNMDSPDYKRQLFNAGWFSGDTCNAAIGQGSIVTTPIQMAMVASAINNNGVYYNPRLIKSVEEFDKSKVENYGPTIQKTIPMSEKSRELILSGMYGVAHNTESVEYEEFNSLPVNLRAKTGTAETFEIVDGIAYPRTNSWIIGTFEIDGRSYSFSIFSIFGPGSYYLAPYLANYLACVNADFPAECL